MADSHAKKDLILPWTIAHQAPMSTGFSRQEYWSGLPSPPAGDLPHLGIEPTSPDFQADSLGEELLLQGKPRVSYRCLVILFDNDALMVKYCILAES